MDIQQLIAFIPQINLERQMILAPLAFFISYGIMLIFKSRLIAVIKSLSRKAKAEIGEVLLDLISQMPGTFYLLVSLFVGLQFSNVPEFFTNTLWYAILLVIVYYGIQASHILLDHFVKKLVKSRQKADKTEDVSFIWLLAKMVKYAMWLVGALVIVANMGVDITALIAGMGVGGLAIALAAQTVLGDIFASFSIYFDKPYKPGDFIIIGDDLGVVERIGIKTTRIKTLRGEELVISNKEMTNTRVHNFGRMPHRRIDFRFGVLYETPVEKVKKIPDIVKSIIESQDLVRFDRAHFQKFGDSSLDFEVVYYLDSADYNKYMDTQQAINIGLMEAFKAEGIGFAYPTRTLYIEREK